jgi:acyl-CoA reductase-like NAD-dependent aldehyde dehydrogenase
LPWPRWATPDEAVCLADATRHGLRTGVFCQDLDVALTFARCLNSPAA